jgi:hypothetical protein
VADQRAVTNDLTTTEDDDLDGGLPDDIDPLDIAEVILLRMGDAIGDPTAQDSHEKMYSYLIGHRATSLYANFLHSLSSPADIAPILALRPLVEAAILLKWISLDPTLHGELWFAQSEDRELTAMRELERNIGLRVRGDIDPTVITESVEDKTAWRDEAVARGKAAGKKYGDRAMPELARLVQEIETADPGHKMAMRQAYDVAYRGFSPWMHSEAASFKSTAVTTPEGAAWVGDVSPYSVEHLRLIAGAMVAYVLEIVGVASGDGSDTVARVIRDYLTIFRALDLSDKSELGEGT